jgi:hypothetical protein
LVRRQRASPQSDPLFGRQSNVADLMADHRADAAVVDRIVGTDVEERLSHVDR